MGGHAGFDPSTIEALRPGLGVTLIIWAFSYCLVLSANPPSEAANKTGPPPRLELNKFDKYFQEQIEKFSGTGIRDCHHQGRRVIFSKTYGVRDLDTKQPITEDTIFVVGSTTKSMTAALIATLVDEGKLAWDDPKSKYLPDFKMPDD